MTSSKIEKREEVRIARLVALAKREGYRNVTVIDGVVCAVHPFVVTWGIMVGIEEWSPGRRYCYEHCEDAMVAFAQYTDPRNTHPTGPWVKCKGIFKGQHVDMLNPELFTPDPATGLMKRKEAENEQD